MSTPQPHHDAAWYHRYRSLRVKLALAVGVLALAAAAIAFLMKSLLTIDPGKGAPFGHAVRTDRHVAVLIQHLEANPLLAPRPQQGHLFRQPLSCRSTAAHRNW